MMLLSGNLPRQFRRFFLKSAVSSVIVNHPLACSSLIIIARLILFMSVCAGGSWRPRVVPVPWARDLIHAQPLNKSSKWCDLET